MSIQGTVQNMGPNDLMMKIAQGNVGQTTVQANGMNMNMNLNNQQMNPMNQMGFMNPMMMNQMNMINPQANSFNQMNMMYNPMQTMNQMNLINQMNLMNQMNRMNINNPGMQTPNMSNQEQINVIFKKGSQSFGGQINEVGGQPGITIQCTPNELVSSLIQKYRSKSNDNEQEEKFIYNAKQLDLTLTVAAAGIMAGSYIFVVSTKGVVGAILLNN